MLHTLFIRESLETMGVTKPTHDFWRASRMRVHRNAKTTPKMRQLIATRAQQGWTYARIAAALGISRKFCMPLLDHLDTARFTRRVGDRRILH